MMKKEQSIQDDSLLNLQNQFRNQILPEKRSKITITEKLTSPKLLVPLAIGLTGLATFIPGTIEGLAQDRSLANSFLYSLKSTPLSSIWEASPEGSINQLIEKYMLALRANIVPALTSGALVTGFLYAVDRARRLGEAIQQGREIIKRKTPQVFALLGEDSYVGDVFFQAAKEHVVPIVEKPEAMKRTLTGKEDKGIFVTIPDGDYGHSGSRSPWRVLKITKDWLLPTKQGKLLLVYGFGETKDEELPLTEEPMVDLTVEELAIATEQIESQAKQKGVIPDKVIRIYVGNPDRRRLRGTPLGIKEVSDREVAEGTVDVFVDAGKTIIEALKKKITGNSIGFETGATEYWKQLHRLASRVGLIVHDENNPDSGQAVLLVYEKTTDESVQSAKDLRNKNPNRRVIVLTSSLDSHRRALKAGVESICVAEVLANKLLEIQKKLINGQTPKKIQTSLL